MKIAALTIVLFLSLSAAAQATPRWAQDGGWLSKREAQRGVTRFAGQIGPLLDTPEASNLVTVRVVAAPKCHRRNHATVLCWFTVHLASQPTTRTGFMVAHLQRNGFVGYKLPWDPIKVRAT